jgi:hypothetical protein
VLQVDALDNVSREGILALRKLKSLEKFLFRNMQDQLIRECLELLPQLHEIATEAMAPGYHRVMNVVMARVFSTIATPCTLQLRCLELDSIYQLRGQVSLPELQVLVLWDPLQMHQLFAGGLPKLSELHLKKTDEDTLLLVLSHVGRQLRTLKFTVFDDYERNFGRAVLLDRVLHACPNLSELYVKSTEYRAVKASQLQPEALKQLKIVTIKFYDCDTSLAPGLLPQILRLAPELRSINVSGYMLFNEDLMEWAELAEQGTCMQNLQKIRFRGHCMPGGVRLLDKMVASCSINCPQMQIATVYYDPLDSDSDNDRSGFNFTQP